MQETSKKQVNKAIASADMLQEVSSGFCIGPLPPSCVGVWGGGEDWAARVVQCSAL